MKHFKKMYFLGIGGIGMSALARFFNTRGTQVYGYDLTETRLTRMLEAEGMNIHYEEDTSLIPADVEVVVFTPAIPEGNVELMWFQKNGYSIVKRAEMLGHISESHKTIAVAGTHGKTSTSSMIAHILKYCGMDISAFLGGILAGDDTNFIQGTGEYIVLEADEYDRSFLHLSPDVLLILSLDADHLDIYKSRENMLKAYEELTLRIPDNGTCLLMGDFIHQFSHGWSERMEARNIRVVELGKELLFRNTKIKNGSYVFDCVLDGEEIKQLESRIPGMHNVSNATAAVYVARSLGLESECIQRALLAFKGISRRFQWLHREGRVLIDDYAHHPSELENAILTVKQLYPERKVLGIFQPHLYSRTRDFYRGFAGELEMLDELWLLDIYPAREEPIEGIRSELIYNLVRNNNKKLLKANKLLEEFEKNIDRMDVVITLGAADLDKYHKQMIEIIKRN